MPDRTRELELFGDDARLYKLCVTLDDAGNCIRLEWRKADANMPVAEARIVCTGFNELTWELNEGGLPQKSSHHRTSIRARINHYRELFPAADVAISAGMIAFDPLAPKPKPDKWKPINLPANQSPWAWLEDRIVNMARELRFPFSPLGQIV